MGVGLARGMYLLRGITSHDALRRCVMPYNATCYKRGHKWGRDVCKRCLTSKTRSLGRAGRKEQPAKVDTDRTYVDTGCDVGPSCLACPLLRCKYDDWPAYVDWRTAREVRP